MYLQEKLLDEQFQSDSPDEKFLQSFADIARNNWLAVSSSLGIELTVEELPKRDNILYVLTKWVEMERVTFKELCSKLRNISLFH